MNIVRMEDTWYTHDVLGNKYLEELAKSILVLL